MKYFTECTTIEELKKAYGTACMKLHPDLNGNATEEEFKKMNAEYNECLKTLGKRSNFANADSLNQLRETHGSHDVETVGRKKIC